MSCGSNKSTAGGGDSTVADSAVVDSTVADSATVDSTVAAPAAFTASAREAALPVAVVLQRRVAGGEAWAGPQWQAVAVVAGEHLPRHAQAVLIHDDGACRRTLHGGLTLRLHTDGGEGYWVNLLSESPYLFVVCEESGDDGGDGDGGLRPAFITANRDEANGYLEADRVVLPAPMPATVCDFVERYVISHYRPAAKKKRARREWAAESDYDQPARRAD